MNQNNTNTRQFSQQTTTNMTQEELQRTQVLNLKDFEEVTKYEKMTSKKPAIIVAIIGILSITFGGVFSVTQSMSSESIDNNQKIEKKQLIDEPVVTNKNLTCVKKEEDKVNGILQTLQIDYTFDEYQQLTSFVKAFAIDIISGYETQGNTYVNNFKIALQPYLAEVPGYKLVGIPTEKGIQTFTEVDYNKLNIASVDQLHQGNYRFNVEYAAKASLESVQTDMQTRGFTCNKK